MIRLKKSFKKTVSILLSAVMIFSLFTIVPFAASAEETANSTELTVNTTELTSGSYTASSNLTIDNRISCAGNVTLTLTDGVTLTVHKGFNVTGSASLTICGQSGGSGKLVIDAAGENNAGIGGNTDQSLSSLNISGGIIEVTGGMNAAGIGGGKNGFGGKVTITGGTVTAKSDGGGAGIGSGALFESNGSINDGDGVYISGGTVNATGGYDAAGIGEGYVVPLTEGDAEMAINISGGTVTAYANNITPETQNPERGKQDIGGDSTTISFTGGNVWANGGGIASANQVIMSWSSVDNSFYAYNINADVLLKKDFKSKENGDEYFYKDTVYSYPEGSKVHPLEHKTLIPPYDNWTYSIPYIDEGGAKKTAEKALKIDSAMVDLPSGWYAVTSDTSGTNTVNIQNRITCSGDVKLIVCDYNTLNALSGITVTEGSSLTIYGQEMREGKLISNAGAINGSAGIGGEENKNSGTIKLVSAMVEATGGMYGAGIGGGKNSSGTVVIFGDTVNATGGQYGAGIGGGYNAPGYVTINRGEVSATGGQYGAGIGGSASDTENSNIPVSTVEINGTRISATGGENGAGIGSGQYGSAEITLNSGVIENAEGGTNGAAIGSGINGSAKVNIKDGTIIQTKGGTSAAAIGGGNGGSCEITISGGTIEKAPGGANGAGIGSGYKGNGSVSISGGTIYNVIGGINSAGIGGGNESKNIDIQISGGTVDCKGGNYGSGIGGGNSTQNITVTITGGHTNAEGGLDSAAIGSYNTEAEINIQGGYVYANGGLMRYFEHANRRVAGIGRGTGSDSTIKLSWTNSDDSIYSNSYTGSITLQKSFQNKNNQSQIFRAGETTSSEIGNKTIVPHNVNEYTVTWKNDNGTVLKTEIFDEGATPVYDGETPAKDEYKFAGWTDGENTYAPDNLPEVTKDVTYTAKFELDGIGARLVGHSLSLDGDIGVNFYMDLNSEIAASRTAYVEFTIPSGNTTYTTKVYVNAQSDENLPFAKQKVYNGKNYYIFKCNVAAKEMTSLIKAQLIDADNCRQGEIYAYSVKQYAEYLLSHTSEDSEFANAVPLVKALLNYGSYSQIYFDKNSDNLANEGLLTAEEKNVSFVTAEMINKSGHSESFTVPEGVKLVFDGASLSLKSKTSLSLFFISDRTLEFECETNKVETEINGSYNIARIRNIASGNAQNDFTVTVKIGGNSFGTITYSPMNYCYNALNGGTDNPELISVVQAFYLYTAAAKDYFPQ